MRVAGAPGASARRFLRSVFLVSAFAGAYGPTLAQNENETVGFQSQHLFDSGSFGEDIDILNGGLTLTTPIGPRYQVNQNLGYQLNLTYTSRIWDMSQWESTLLNAPAGLMRRGPMGLGHILNFGRIYRDVAYVSKQNADRSTSYEFQCTWYFVTPDGNEHELPMTFPKDGGATCRDAPVAGVRTVDGTYFTFYVTGAGTWPWNGVGPAPTLIIITPNHRRYTFGNFVPVHTPTAPVQVEYNSSSDFTYQSTAYRHYNKDFGGWYVTKIEDGLSGPNATGYTAWVQIAYDMNGPNQVATPGYEHVIKTITDSAQRTITFTNNCSQSGGSCVRSPMSQDDPNSPIRNAVRTEEIDLPGFNGTIAKYNFSYEYADQNDVLHSTPTPANQPTNRLLTIQYPGLCKHNSTQVCTLPGTPERYAMTFVYNPYGEMQSRTLPTGGTFSYTWGTYVHLTVGVGGFPFNIAGPTRELRIKSRALLAGEAVPPGSAETCGAGYVCWFYTRDATLYSNPKEVTVTDLFGNDTVYSYRASPFDTLGRFGRCPQDGWAPEWNDGLNWKIEHYQGTGTARKLVQTETRDYEGDTVSCGGTTQTDKTNVRTSRMVTTYLDGGGQSIAANSNWDSMGHWRQVTESGDGVDGTRTTRRDYVDFDAGFPLYTEVTDGRRVISRSDYYYDANRRLSVAIERTTLPAKMGTARDQNPSAKVNDIVTMYTYDSNGNVIQKDINSHGVTQASGNTDYRILYTWQAGGYLATKTFWNFTNNLAFPWKAIDRTRDANTGLVSSSRDTAGIQTTYSYDALGRVTDIIPTTPENPTRIEYATVQSTTVRQVDAAASVTDYSCSILAGDYILSCYDYDNLGRLVKTQKRPYDPTLAYPYQTTVYNAAGRTTFQSEWLWPSQTTCGVGSCSTATNQSCTSNASCPTGQTCVLKTLSTCGTSYDYSDPSDATQMDLFGRVRRVTPVDDASGDKVTQTDYFGTSSKVTARGIQGKGGTFSATTTYYRDAWGRLIRVQAPSGYCNLTTTKACVSDSQCPTGPPHEICQGGGADAMYAYDLRDNLVQVDLVEKTSLGRQTRLFEYDPLNRLTFSWNPESGATEVAGFDALGNVKDQVDASGNHLLSTYDGAGRLTTLSWWLYQGSSSLLATNVYDQADVSFGSSLGRLTTTQDLNDAGVLQLTRTYSYAGLNGRLSALVQGIGSLAYTYNNFGLVSSLAYPEGPAGKGGAFTVNDTYANGFPTKVASPPTAPGTPEQVLASAKKYNAAGGFQELWTTGDAGNVTTTITPDARNRPGEITVTFSAQTLYPKATYQYDGAGNIASIVQDNPGQPASPYSNLYKYDPANRLVQAEVYPQGTYHKQVFSYDDYGNMINKVQTNASGSQESTDTFVVTDQTTKVNTNRVIQHIPTTGANFFTYDERGNLIIGDSQDYTYDGRNRLLSARVTSGNRFLARYVYDGSAARVRKDDLGQGVSTFYVRDPQGRLMSEFRRTLNGNYMAEWSKHYAYLGDRLVAMRENRVPSPVSGLSATLSAGKVNLSWNTNPSGEQVSGYNVYRSPYPTINWTRLTATPLPASPTTYIDKVASGTWYEYAITAKDASNAVEGYASDPLVVYTSAVAPSVPTGLSATPGYGRVDLMWNANPPGDYVVGYYAYRADCQRGTPHDTCTATARITTVPWTATSFTDLKLVNDGNYYYTYYVSARNSSGVESAKSVPVSVTPNVKTNHVPPGAPTGLKATADCSAAQINLSWFPNMAVDNVKQYVVYRNPRFPGGLTDPSPSGPVTTTAYVDQAISADNTYEYYVVAQNSTFFCSNSPTTCTTDANCPGGVCTLNTSQPSLRARATPRSSTIPTPARPGAQSGENTVTVRVPVATVPASVTAINLYRKPNANASCDDYQYVQSVSISPTYTDIVDAAVPNAVAYDYAVTYADAGGRESLNSPPALGIPLEPPKKYKECYEYLHTGDLNFWKEGAETCFGSNQKLNRLVVRWQKPQARSYQPYSATSADGTLGFLKGYHIYYYAPDFNAVASQNDHSLLEPLGIDYLKHYCIKNPGIPCAQDSNCPSGDTCHTPARYTDNNHPNDFVPRGTCGSLGSYYCHRDYDCPASTPTCNRAPIYEDLSDPYITMFRDDGITTYHTNSNFNPVSAYKTCFAAKAVYKVFANDTWLTVESGFSDNFAVTNNSSPTGRCTTVSLDSCIFDPQYSACANQGAETPPPPTLSAPTVAQTANADEVQVAWAPPSMSGICQLKAPSDCPFSFQADACATGQVCEACSPDQGCANTGRCVLQNPAVCDPKAATPCPTLAGDPPQICRPRDIGGYQLYAMEGPFPTHYHFVHSSPFLTFDKDTTSYTLKGLMPSYAFSFQIATVDRTGRVSDPSPPSAPINAKAGTTPSTAASFKNTIWTLNDLTLNNSRTPYGIKLRWGSGGDITGVKGYRLYRSTTSGGPYCAFVGSAQTSLNPCLGTGIPITDDITGTGIGSGQLDTTVTPNIAYYYALKTVTTTGQESAFSQEIAGRALGLPKPGQLQQTTTFSPPAQFKAYAPRGNTFPLDLQRPPDYKGIYLQWCPNDYYVDGVRGYRVYRSQQPQGPYTKVAEVPTICVDGEHRCEISIGVCAPDGIGGCTGGCSMDQFDRVCKLTPSPQCKPGLDGTCHVVDKVVDYSRSGTGLDTHDVYYYVVTAIRYKTNSAGNPILVGGLPITDESTYSLENQGWPNFCDEDPADPAASSCRRFDPDNFPDIACGDEVASNRYTPSDFRSPYDRYAREVSSGDSAPRASMAPYRTIGQADSIVPLGAASRYPGDGDGGGGGSPPPGPTQTLAFPRFLFYHLDHLGSPRVITNVAGALISKHDYMPFGEEYATLAQNQNSTNNRKFTGHERDAESGMDYMMARYYGSSIDRFLAVDPIPLEPNRLMVPQGLNLFSCAANNPINYVDRTGKEVELAIRELRLAAGYHTFIRVIPTGNNVELFRSLIGPAGSITLSGFPEGGRLVRRFNAEVDAWSNQTIKLKPLGGQTMEQFEANVIAAFNDYLNGSLKYAPVPSKRGKGYNSNSLSSGVLDAGGAEKPTSDDFIGWVPGWEKPVPIPRTYGVSADFIHADPGEYENLSKGTSMLGYGTALQTYGYTSSSGKSTIFVDGNYLGK